MKKPACFGSGGCGWRNFVPRVRESADGSYGEAGHSR